MNFQVRGGVLAEVERRAAIVFVDQSSPLFLGLMQADLAQRMALLQVAQATASLSRSLHEISAPSLDSVMAEIDASPEEADRLREARRQVRAGEVRWSE